MAEEDARKRGYGTTVAMALLVFVVVYVLSVGPVVVLVERWGTGEAVIEVVYRPLGWLHDNTPLRQPVDAYLEFWQRVTGTP